MSESLEPERALLEAQLVGTKVELPRDPRPRAAWAARLSPRNGTGHSPSRWWPRFLAGRRRPPREPGARGPEGAKTSPTPSSRTAEDPAPRTRQVPTRLPARRRPGEDAAPHAPACNLRRLRPLNPSGA